MTLQKYPLDTQYCPMVLESCKYNISSNNGTLTKPLTSIVRSHAMYFNGKSRCIDNAAYKSWDTVIRLILKSAECFSQNLAQSAPKIGAVRAPGDSRIDIEL